LDIVHADQKLYLVFEFLDVDLKRYMEAGNSQGTPLSLELCQVRIIQKFSLSSPNRSLSDIFHLAAGSTPVATTRHIFAPFTPSDQRSHGRLASSATTLISNPDIRKSMVPTARISRDHAPRPARHACCSGIRYSI